MRSSFAGVANAVVDQDVDNPSAAWTVAWLWAFPAVFLLHDGEEAIYLAVRHGMTTGGLALSTAQCLAGMMLEFTVIWLLTLGATRRLRPGWPVWILAGLLGGWAAHGLGHVVAGAVSDHYVMGAITGLPAGFVYGGLALARLLRSALLTRKILIIATLGGVAASWPLIKIAHVFGFLVG